MCQQETWSTRTLQERLDSQLFERTALSRQPDALLAQELASLRQSGVLKPTLLLKDPYVLDFLGLNDRYLEKDLEDAFLRELELFLLELGAGFTFVARQFINTDYEKWDPELTTSAFTELLARVDCGPGCTTHPWFRGQLALYLLYMSIPPESDHGFHPVPITDSTRIRSRIAV